MGDGGAEAGQSQGTGEERQSGEDTSSSNRKPDSTSRRTSKSRSGAVGGMSVEAEFQGGEVDVRFDLEPADSGSDG